MTDRKRNKSSSSKTNSKEFEETLKGRFQLLCLLILVGTFLVIFRASQLQVFPHARLKKLASSQFKKVIQLEPRRGTIVDSQGRIMALSVEKYSVYALKQHIKDPWRTAQAIAPILKVSRPRVLEILRRKGTFRWLIRKIEREPAEAISKLNLPGIEVVPESKRVYPQNRIASHVLGFVGQDGLGLEGIEKKFNGLLKGESKKFVTLRDNYRRPIYLQNDATQNARDGYKLHLTLDSRLQYLSEKFLDETLEKYKAEQGTVILMDPTSGAIRVLANRPTFDPNIGSRTSVSDRRNRVITDSFEPGSTLKMVTLAGALETGVLKPTDTIDPEHGRFRIGKYVINEAHEDVITRPLTPEEVLMKSNNVCAAKIALTMGPENFARILESFGFGEKTGIDLPGEAVGLLKPQSQWKGINLATMGFGQGISVTPLQLLRAYAIIANGGYSVTPYLVERVEGPSGEIAYEKQVPQRRPVLSTFTVQHMTRWLQTVFSKGGTASNLEIPMNIGLAGKTGTAQIPDPEKGGYKQGAYVASFIGFGPNPNPRFVLFVSIHHPKPIYYANIVAGPLWKQIAYEVLNPSEKLNVAEDSRVPRMNSDDSEIAKQIPQKTEATRELPQTVKTPEPSFGELAKQEVQSLSLDDTDRSSSPVASMPSLEGLSLREALNKLASFRQRVEVIGNGRVIHQWPRASDKVAVDTPLRITLSTETP